MSCSENEASNAATFNMFTGHFVEFERCFWSKTDHFMVNLGTNVIEHVSEMELYNISSTLEKFECWNQSFNYEISADEMVVGVQSSP